MMREKKKDTRDKIIEGLKFDEKLLDDLIEDLDDLKIEFDPNLLKIEEEDDKMREDLKNLEKLLLSLSEETQKDIGPRTYISTVTGEIGDDELNFWGNYEPENQDDINTVEEIYEVAKKVYEEAQK